MSEEDARTRSIRALFPLVRVVARRVQRMLPGADFDDLIGDGSVGLIRAVDTFDPVHGVPLTTYAQRVISGAMLNGVRRTDPVSERARRTMRRAERERTRIAAERGDMPTMREMERYDPALARARAVVHTRTTLSLDAPFPARDAAEADATVDPARIVLERAQRQTLLAAIAGLPARQQHVVAMHYWNDVPLRTVSRELNVSPQRISQLHCAALATLRGRLEHAL